jgi:hypothetical protein
VRCSRLFEHLVEVRMMQLNAASRCLGSASTPLLAETAFHVLRWSGCLTVRLLVPASHAVL